MPFPPSPRPLAYDPAVANRLLLRILAGEELRDLWRDQTLPSRYTLIAWRRDQPEFAATLRAAVNFARSQVRIARSPYGPDTEEEIFERLLSGRPMRSICQDADMPKWTTVLSWLRTRPDFRQGVALAREMALEANYALAKRIVDATNPETLSANDKALRHIRWNVGKRMGKRYI